MGAGRATIESEHCRAICDEIGDRLREILSRDAPEPSAHLLQLLLNSKLRRSFQRSKTCGSIELRTFNTTVSSRCA